MFNLCTILQDLFNRCYGSVKRCTKSCLDTIQHCFCIDSNHHNAQSLSKRAEYPHLFSLFTTPKHKQPLMNSYQQSNNHEQTSNHTSIQGQNQSEHTDVAHTCIQPQDQDHFVSIQTDDQPFAEYPEKHNHLLTVFKPMAKPVGYILSLPVKLMTQLIETVFDQPPIDYLPTGPVPSLSRVKPYDQTLDNAYKQLALYHPSEQADRVFNGVRITEVDHIHEVIAAYFAQALTFCLSTQTIPWTKRLKALQHKQGLDSFQDPQQRLLASLKTMLHIHDTEAPFIDPVKTVFSNLKCPIHNPDQALKPDWVTQLRLLLAPWHQQPGLPSPSELTVQQVVSHLNTLIQSVAYDLDHQCPMTAVAVDLDQEPVQNHHNGLGLSGHSALLQRRDKKPKLVLIYHGDHPKIPASLRLVFPAKPMLDLFYEHQIAVFFHQALHNYDWLRIEKHHRQTRESYFVKTLIRSYKHGVQKSKSLNNPSVQSLLTHADHYLNNPNYQLDDFNYHSIQDRVDNIKKNKKHQHIQVVKANRPHKVGESSKVNASNSSSSLRLRGKLSMAVDTNPTQNTSLIPTDQHEDTISAEQNLAQYLLDRCKPLSNTAPYTFNTIKEMLDLDQSVMDTSIKLHQQIADLCFFVTWCFNPIQPTRSNQDIQSLSPDERISSSNQPTIYRDHNVVLIPPEAVSHVVNKPITTHEAFNSNHPPSSTQAHFNVYFMIRSHKWAYLAYGMKARFFRASQGPHSNPEVQQTMLSLIRSTYQALIQQRDDCMPSFTMQSQLSQAIDCYQKQQSSDRYHQKYKWLSLINEQPSSETHQDQIHHKTYSLARYSFASTDLPPPNLQETILGLLLQAPLPHDFNYQHFLQKASEADQQGAFGRQLTSLHPMELPYLKSAKDLMHSEDRPIQASAEPLLHFPELQLFFDSRLYEGIRYQIHQLDSLPSVLWRMLFSGHMSHYFRHESIFRLIHTQTLVPPDYLMHDPSEQAQAPITAHQYNLSLGLQHLGQSTVGATQQMLSIFTQWVYIQPNWHHDPYNPVQLLLIWSIDLYQKLSAVHQLFQSDQPNAHTQLLSPLADYDSLDSPLAAIKACTLDIHTQLLNLLAYTDNNQAYIDQSLAAFILNLAQQETSRLKAATHESIDDGLSQSQAQLPPSPTDQDAQQPVNAICSTQPSLQPQTPAALDPINSQTQQQILACIRDWDAHKCQHTWFTGVEERIMRAIDIETSKSTYEDVSGISTHHLSRDLIDSLSSTRLCRSLCGETQIDDNTMQLISFIMDKSSFNHRLIGLNEASTPVLDSSSTSHQPEKDHHLPEKAPDLCSMPYTNMSDAPITDECDSLDAMTLRSQASPHSLFQAKATDLPVVESRLG